MERRTAEVAGAGRGERADMAALLGGVIRILIFYTAYEEFPLNIRVLGAVFLGSK
jgi:hypothetical protein